MDEIKNEPTPEVSPLETISETVPKKSFDVTPYILPSAIVIAAVMISGTLLYTNGQKVGTQNAQIGANQQPVSVSTDDDPALGNPNAKVTVIEFSDFQCPFCRRFWKETLPQIKKLYIDTGKIEFVYRDFPLGFHPASHISAEAANCAGEQSKYWEFHDKMFSEEEKLGQGTVEYGASQLKLWARQIGLNPVQFNQCLDSGKYKAEVDKDIADGSAAGVDGTPTFFINGKKIVGAQALSAFQAIIDAELK